MAYTKVYKTLQIQTREQFTASEPTASTVRRVRLLNRSAAK